MQSIACQTYQDIWSYADHILGVVRVLTLAKWSDKKELQPPIKQLLQQVARGWTMNEKQHNGEQDDLTQMGLAVCLMQFVSKSQLDKQKCDLPSHYADYFYRVLYLQHQHHTPLFLSLRRHCGRNLHAVQIIDRILVNTSNNTAYHLQNHLQKGDLWALFLSARHEYEVRYTDHQCESCYKPGVAKENHSWAAHYPSA